MDDFCPDSREIARIFPPATGTTPNQQLIAINGHLDFYDKHFQIAIDIKGRRPLLLLRGLSATVVEELNDVLNKAMAATG